MATTVIKGDSHSDPYPIIDRDISWLSFNARVLQEAEDKSVPLFERIKFLAIYSSNLGEFFGVRVSQHRNLMRVRRKTKKELHINPKNVLSDILRMVKEQQTKLNDIFNNQIVPELASENIRLLRRLELNEEQSEFVADYFRKYMLPFVQPVLLVKNKIRPFLNNSALYLAVHMLDHELKKKKDVYALVKIPSNHLPRFVNLPSKEGCHDVIYLDDIVRHSISWLFPGYEIQDTFSIKLTRDAELYIDDEYSGDLIEKIKDSLIKRNIGPASRLVFDDQMPPEMLDYFVDILHLDNLDLIPEGRYHNNFDLFKFPKFGRSDLHLQPLDTLGYAPLEECEDYFQAIREQDHIIMFPFHSYESTIRFFEEAADDPMVTHIKIIQYRVAKTSRIMKALMNAVERGKHVSAFIEIKARFDEEANLKWGEELEKAGVDVHYSFPGLKVHAKCALIRRIENGIPSLYSYMSTGNFHEDTAKVYSDFGFFTADSRITTEVAHLLSVLETESLPDQSFSHLLVGQFNLKDDLIAFIQQEITHAKAGRKAEIFLKVNSLQDKEMIDHLYSASQAGVKVRIICRGICCVVPQIEGVSENIEIISIVDRYLEHARVFAFYNDGDVKLYLSSADWMQRNLNYRIETAFPIYDERARKVIFDIMHLQWSDNTKARILDMSLSNQYRTGGTIKIQSQLETYYYFKRQMEILKQEQKI